MYYSYELLCRKPNGKFAVIWLLSNSRKVPVREVMRIPFPDIIDDVENIVVRRYPDHLPESIGSRFSLYLSSKLCYGIVLALKTQLNSLTSELRSLCLFSAMSSTERSIPKGRAIAGPSEEPDKKRRKKHKRSLEAEVDPTALPALDPTALPALDPTVLPALEDLDIVDLVRHLEVNGAAVRVPVEHITLLDEMVPDIRLVVEDEDFGQISELDLQRFFLSHHGEGRVPDIQEQTPAHDRPPVPATATEQLPRTSVETETHPAATESQITVPVTAPEPPQRSSSTPLIPAAERAPALPLTPALSPIPVTQPAPALAQTPAIEPAPVLAQTPAIEPAPALEQIPAIEPAPALAQTPGIEPAPAVPPTEASEPPLPAAPATRIRRISASPLVLDQDIQLSPPIRRRRRRRLPFQDKRTQISLRDLADRIQSSKQDIMRVQEATEDALNIEFYRNIIPAQKLLGSVRVALFPDELKNLFSRHMHTQEMPTDSLEEELLREPGSSSTSLSSMRSESFQLSHSGRGSRLERSIGVPAVLETITEGTEADAEAHQIQLDALAERIPEVSQILVQEVPLPEPPPEEVLLPEPPPEEMPLREPPPKQMPLPEPPPEQMPLPEPPAEEMPLQEPLPEELPTVQPQEPEMQGVPHEEEMASTEKCEEEQLDLEAQKMMQKLQSLWDAGTAVTFGLICPPGSNDKMSALATFDLLLHMNHEGMIRLRQNLPWPPPYPRPPIYILPWQ